MSLHTPIPTATKRRLIAHYLPLCRAEVRNQRAAKHPGLTSANTPEANERIARNFAELRASEALRLGTVEDVLSGFTLSPTDAATLGNKGGDHEAPVTVVAGGFPRPASDPMPGVSALLDRLAFGSVAR